MNFKKDESFLGETGYVTSFTLDTHRMLDLCGSGKGGYHYTLMSFKGLVMTNVTNWIPESCKSKGYSAQACQFLPTGLSLGSQEGLGVGQKMGVRDPMLTHRQKSLLSAQIHFLLRAKAFNC